MKPHKTPNSIYPFFRSIGRIGGSRVKDLIEKGKRWEAEHPEHIREQNDAAELARQELLDFERADAPKKKKRVA